MASRHQFTDPTPLERFEKRTSECTDTEVALVEKFDALSLDKAENITGTLLRAAVDIARYRRSLKFNPEHYTRLILVTEKFAQIRVLRSCIEDPQLSTDINDTLEKIDWSSVTEVPRPRILTTLPYAGTEDGPVTLMFIDQPQAFHTDLPA